MEKKGQTFPAEELKVLEVDIMREVENRHENTAVIAAGRIHWRTLKSEGDRIFA